MAHLSIIGTSSLCERWSITFHWQHIGTVPFANPSLTHCCAGRKSLTVTNSWYEKTKKQKKKTCLLKDPRKWHITPKCWYSSTLMGDSVFVFVKLAFNVIFLIYLWFAINGHLINYASTWFEHSWKVQYVRLSQLSTSCSKQIGGSILPE